MTVAAPKDENELQHMLATAIGSGRPFAIRYPRGLALGVELDPALQDDPDRHAASSCARAATCTLFAYGSMVSIAIQAAEELEKRGISCGVANARFAKPLDMELLRRIVADDAAAS